MRRLLYVPIVHDEADLGSFGAILTRQSVAITGERRWVLHQSAVRGFWQSVEAFLISFDARGMKVYQDGLAVGGELARRIVQEAASRGSNNYQIVLRLMNRGAVLQKTENVHLLLEEHKNLGGPWPQETLQEGHSKAMPLPTARDRLLEERDSFIARTIDETLGEGEVGVLFLGAHHNVEPLLPPSLLVVKVKDRERVVDYLSELFYGRDDAKLEALADYLAAPVDAVA